MAQFTVRVELHSADWLDYEKLHDEMSSKGFLREITSDAGKSFKLPPAEYRYLGSADRSEVLERAKLAARHVKASYAVLVTESVSCTWFGLEAA
jgi:hypothetical protein